MTEVCEMHLASGSGWLLRLKRHFHHIIWLKPKECPRRDSYFVYPYDQVARTVDIFPLTIDGLEQGTRSLLA